MSVSQEENIPGSSETPVITEAALKIAIRDRNQPGRRNIPIEVNIAGAEDFQEEIRGIDAVGLTFTGTFRNCSLYDFALNGCKLSNINFLNCELYIVSFTGCDLDNCNFKEGTTLTETVFEICSISRMIIANDTEFNDVKFLYLTGLDKIIDENGENLNKQKLKDRGVEINEDENVPEEEEDIAGPPPITTVEAFNGAVQDRIRSGRLSTPIDVNITEGNITGDFEGLTIRGTFTYINFNGTQFTSCNFTGVSFLSCMLDGCSFNGETSLESSKYTNSELGGMIISENTILNGADFRDANDVDEILDNDEPRPINAPGLNIISIQELLNRGAILDDWLTEGLQRQSSNESEMGVGPFAAESGEQGERPDFSDLESRLARLRQDLPQGQPEEEDGFDNPFLPENLLSKQQVTSFVRTVLQNTNIDNVSSIDDVITLVYSIEDEIYKNDVIQERIKTGLGIDLSEYLNKETKPIETIMRVVSVIILNLIMDNAKKTIPETVEVVTPLATEEMKKYFTVTALKTLGNPFLPEKEIPRVKANLNTKVEFNDPITLDEFSGSIEEYIDEDINNVVVVYQKKKEGKLVDEYFFNKP